MPLNAVLDRKESFAPVPQRGAPQPYRVLVADDQRDVIEAVRLLLTGNDFLVAPATSPATAVALAEAETFDAALIDLNYEQGRTSGEQGLDLIKALLDRTPALPVIVMTAWSSIELALEAMRRGAKDFIEKPWDEGRLVSMLRGQAELGRALRRVETLERENSQLRQRAETAGDIPQLTTLKLLEVEGLLVRHAMERHRGNVSRAARTLGLSRSALYRRLERHKI